MMMMMMQLWVLQRVDLLQCVLSWVLSNVSLWLCVDRQTVTWWVWISVRISSQRLEAFTSAERSVTLC